MLGAIVGDIVGSVYEFNNHRSKDFPLFHEDSIFTDDSILTIATADALMSDDCDFAASYREYGRKFPSTYGIGFSEWIHDDEAGPYNSFGNGSAMRVSPVAWFENDERKVMDLAQRSAEVTHNHPEGIKGAQATAMVILWARQGVPRDRIRQDLETRFGYDTSTSVAELQEIYEYNETCQRTVPEAFRCFYEATDFEDAIRNAISIGGDSDTVAAIAGSMAEAKWGVPEEIGRVAFARLQLDLQHACQQFRQQVERRHAAGGISNS
jgi:ADP-ribosylglycohydrolase